MAFFLQELVNGITTGALYALMALSFTMVYGVLKLLKLRADTGRWCVIFQLGPPLIRSLGRSESSRSPVSFHPLPERRVTEKYPRFHGEELHRAHRICGRLGHSPRRSWHARSTCSARLS